MLKDMLKQYLDESGEDKQKDFFFDEYNSSWGDAEPDDFMSDNGIAFSVVDSYGGEGQGDRYDCTYKFTKGEEDVFVQFWGWYASYEGATYEDYSFVTPKQKTVTVYD